MAFPRKSSQPREARFQSKFAAIPASASAELREWDEDRVSTFKDDHQSIEDWLADLRAELEAIVVPDLTSIEARLTALEARPVGGTTTIDNSTTVTAADELTADQKTALKGTNGAPSNANRYVVSDDPRLLPVKNVCPVGTVLDYAGITAPAGWLLCDGAPVSREVYKILFALIGVTFGAGDTTTTFNLPDCRGRSSMGAGTGSGLTARTLGQALGAETHTLTGAESGLPAHAHTVPWRDNSCASGSDNDTGTMTSGPDITVDTSTVGPTDAASSHPNIHPVIVLNRIIKF